MEFEQFLSEAANYLEDSGISYSADMDDALWALYCKGERSFNVVRFFKEAA